MYKPLKGHVLVIPIPSEANKQGKCVTINWVYFLQDYSGEYYTFVAKNKNSGDETVVLFIQSEYYNHETLHEYGRRKGREFEIDITDKLQYGEARSNGEGRFVVLHDKSRKMFQHRFIETAIGSKLLMVAEKMAETIGIERPASGFGDCMKGKWGDYLRTF